MAEPRLICDYLADLDRLLPAAIVEELADGLEETFRVHLASGLDPDSAAGAAVAEFGAPSAIAAEFTRTAPARRAACALLRAGPVVGGCWAVALISARAWQWAVPAIVPLLLAAVLIMAVALLCAAAFCDLYRPARRAAHAALITVLTFDLALPGLLLLPGLLHGAAFILAAGLSLARAAFAASALQRIHAG